jgi:predicted phosphohydrolase
MKIQYASDLHLEFPENKEFLKKNPLVPAGDVLLLAGDIVPFAIMDKHADFFNFISDNFGTTYWIPGNHEYYYSDISERSGSFSEAIRSNVFLINNTSVILGNVKLIFSTLWSEIGALNKWVIQQRISDFQVINYKTIRFSPDHFNGLHHEGHKFLINEIEMNFSGKIVVATHHVPVLLNYPEQYKSDVLNEAFAVNLYDLIAKSNIDYWIYGHHHVNVDEFAIGDTILNTNQLGYVRYNENVGFINNKYINV